MNEEDVAEGLRFGMRGQRVVDRRYGGGYEEGEDECDDEMTSDEDVNENCVEDSNERESIADAMNGIVRFGEELIYDIAQ